MKTIQIDEDIHRYLVSKAADIGESASKILRRELGLDQPADTIEIDDDIYSYLVSRMVEIGETASHILRRELRLDEDHPHGPVVVEFHIPAGTGNRPWNTREQAVAATVGDTLRVVNDDAVPHRLHTAGDPFPHAASDIAPGQSADYVLQTPFEPGANPSTYDHNFGPAAAFWIRVRAAA